MKFALIAGFIMFFCFKPCLAEVWIDKIYLNDSTTVVGTIDLLVPDKYAIISVLDGKRDTIPMNRIIKIWKTDKLDISIYDKNYFELGLNLGTPGIINLYAGYWFSPLGLSVSGLGDDKQHAIHANIKIKLSDTYASCHSLSLVLGSVKNYFYEYDINNSFLMGLAYNFNYRGFWLQVGIPIFQIGYTYRFI